MKGDAYGAALACAADVLDKAFRSYAPVHADAVRRNMDRHLVKAIELEIANLLIQLWDAEEAQRTARHENEAAKLRL
jgi:hypothetical protein